MLVTALGVAGGVALVALIMDLVFGQNRAKGIGAALLSTAVNACWIWLYYFLAVPAVVGPFWGYTMEILISLVVTTAVFAVVTADGFGQLRPQPVRPVSTPLDDVSGAEPGSPGAESATEGTATRNLRRARQPKQFKRFRLWIWGELKSAMSATEGQARTWYHDVPGAALTGALTAIMSVVVMVMVIFTPLNNGEAKDMAALIEVTPGELNALPPVIPEQFPIVPLEAAQDKVEQKYGSTNIPAGYKCSNNGRTRLGTRFSVGPASTVFHEGRMQHAFELLHSSQNNNTRCGGEIPGYILVDAVNQNAPIQMVWTKIKFASVHTGTQQVNRHIWAHKNLKHYMLDELHLEPDDNGVPHQVGALTNHAARYDGRVPVLAVWVNAWTGEIKTAPLGQTPDWIDRVLSAETVKWVTTVHGLWDQENIAYLPWPWKGKKSGDRYEPDGEPQIIYTARKRIQWQVLVKTKTYAVDNTVTDFLIFDEHELKATIYPADNVTTQKRTTEVVQDAIGNGQEAMPGFLVPMLGELTWAVPVLSPRDEDNDTNTRQTIAGLALVQAGSVSKNNVQFRPSRDEAVFAYHGWLNRNQQTLRGSGEQVTGTGKVVWMDRLVLHGEEIWMVEIDDPNPKVRDKIFRININTTGMPLEVRHLKPGVTVTFKCFDVTRQICDVSNTDVAGVNEPEGIGT